MSRKMPFTIFKDLFSFQRFSSFQNIITYAMPTARKKGGLTGYVLFQMNNN